jgi:hypothetical protein
MEPAGNLWNSGETRFRMESEKEMTPENMGAAEKFWDSLLEIP